MPVSLRLRPSMNFKLFFFSEHDMINGKVSMVYRVCKKVVVNVKNFIKQKHF
jgi:hypothetical protein